MSFMDLNSYFMELHHDPKVVARFETAIGWDLFDYALFVKWMLKYGQLVDYS